MAATSTKVETKKVVSNTEVVYGEYQGKPTIAVCPEGKPFQGFQAGMGKWNRLFGLDKDGDSVLVEVFKGVYENTDAEGREHLVDCMSLFLEKVQEFVVAQQGGGETQPPAGEQPKA